MDHRWRISHEQCPEVEFFENDFINGALDGGESEQGFGKKEGGLGGADVEEVAEYVGPDRRL